jgi:hypothetical protein
MTASAQEGMAHISDAAQRRHGQALAQLALFAAWGVMRPRNLGEALDGLARAAECGWNPAQRELQFLARHPGTDWNAMRRSIDIAAWTRAPAARAISEAPRIRVFEGFARADECDWLIARASGSLRRAQVYRRDALGTKETGERTNSEADFTANNADIVLNLIRDRIGAAAQTDVGFFEVAKLLHYQPGQQFSLHADFIETNTPALAQDVAAHGQRVATFLIYLNDDYSGGETDFPRIDFRFKGRRGDALLFFNVTSTGTPDYNTLHAGLPPDSGMKWMLSQWIRDRRVGVG